MDRSGEESREDNPGKKLGSTMATETRSQQRNARYHGLRLPAVPTARGQGLALHWYANKWLASGWRKVKPLLILSPATGLYINVTTMDRFGGCH